MSGMTREDKIRNKYIEDSVGLASMLGEMQINRLKWFRDLGNRDRDRENRHYVEGKRGRG